MNKQPKLVLISNKKKDYSLLSDEQLAALLNLVVLDKQGSSKIKTLQHCMSTSTLTKKTLGLKPTIWRACFLIISKQKTFFPTFKIRQTMWEKKLAAYCKSATTPFLKKVQHQMNIVLSNTK